MARPRAEVDVEAQRPRGEPEASSTCARGGTVLPEEATTFPWSKVAAPKPSAGSERHDDPARVDPGRLARRRRGRGSLMLPSAPNACHGGVT
jgi:hypothetical protein